MNICALFIVHINLIALKQNVELFEDILMECVLLDKIY